MTLRKANPIWQPPPVVRTTLSSVQRKCACGDRATQAANAPGTIGSAKERCNGAAVSATPVNDTPPIVHDVLRSSGQPLDEATRAFMESRFGYDFSQRAGSYGCGGSGVGSNGECAGVHDWRERDIC